MDSREQKCWLFLLPFLLCPSYRPPSWAPIGNKPPRKWLPEMNGKPICTLEILFGLQSSMVSRALRAFVHGLSEQLYLRTFLFSERLPAMLLIDHVPLELASPLKPLAPSLSFSFSSRLYLTIVFRLRHFS